MVSRRPDKSLHRHGWAEVHARASQLCNALTKLGVKRGSRVATLCWNHTQHLEAYLGVPAMGAIVHTLNLRLHPSELRVHLGRHAEDEVVIVDRTLLPLLAKFRNEIPSLRHVIVVPDDGPATPEQGHDYEKLIAAERPEYAFPTLDERAAAMICYTSGTTGNPKGVVYTTARACCTPWRRACATRWGSAKTTPSCPVAPMPPRGRVGPAVRGGGVWREARVPGPAPGRGLAVPWPPRRSHRRRGRAHHLARHPRAARRGSQDPTRFVERALDGDWRLGGASGDD